MRTRNDMQLTKYGPGGQGILPGGNCPSELSQRPMYIIVATTVSICQRILAIRDLPFSTSSVIPLSARTTLLRTFCHSLTGYPLTYSVEYSTFVILPSLGFWILSRSPGDYRRVFFLFKRITADNCKVLLFPSRKELVICRHRQSTPYFIVMEACPFSITAQYFCTAGNTI